MAKLFIQTIPTEEQVRESINRLQEGVDATPAFLNVLFMKVATDMENYTEQVLAPYNLSGGRFMLLFLLRDAPQGLIPSEISNQVGVTQATISGLINGLEKQELVRRETHEKDGRSFVIKLTEKGDALLREIFPQWNPRMTAYWMQFSPEERQLMKQLFGKLAASTGLLNAIK